MSTMDLSSLSILQYLCQKRCYRSIERFCQSDALGSSSGTSTSVAARFFRLLGGCLARPHLVGVWRRELEALYSVPQTQNDLKLPCLVLLLFLEETRSSGGNSGNLANSEQLKAEVDLAEAEGATVLAQYLRSVVYYHTNKYREARDVLSRTLGSKDKKLTPDLASSMHCLRGWVDLDCGRDQFQRKADRHFQSALSSIGGTARNPWAALGRSQFALRVAGNAEHAAKSLSQLAVDCPEYQWIAFTELAYVSCSLGQVESAMETCQRVMDMGHGGTNMIVPLMVELLWLYLSISFKIGSDASGSGSQQYPMFSLRELYSDIGSSIAPTASQLWFENAQMLMHHLDAWEEGNVSISLDVVSVLLSLSLISGTTALFVPLLTGHAKRLIDSLANAQSRVSFDLYLFFATILLLQRDYVNAQTYFQRALDSDAASLEAMCGVVECQIMLGSFDDAGAQLELFRGIRKTLGDAPMLPYLEALYLLHVNMGGQSGKRGSPTSTLDECNGFLASAFSFYGKQVGKAVSSKNSGYVWDLMRIVTHGLLPFADRLMGLYEDLYLLADSMAFLRVSWHKELQASASEFHTSLMGLLAGSGQSMLTGGVAFVGPRVSKFWSSCLYVSGDFQNALLHVQNALECSSFLDTTGLLENGNDRMQPQSHFDISLHLHHARVRWSMAFAGAGTENYKDAFWTYAVQPTGEHALAMASNEWQSHVAAGNSALQHCIALDFDAMKRPLYALLKSRLDRFSGSFRKPDMAARSSQPGQLGARESSLFSRESLLESMTDSGQTRSNEGPKIATAEELKRSLQSALQNKSMPGYGFVHYSLYDRLTIFFELCYCCASLRQFHEATKVLNDAQNVLSSGGDFHSGIDSVRLRIVSVHLLMLQNQVSDGCKELDKLVSDPFSEHFSALVATHRALSAYHLLQDYTAYLRIFGEWARVMESSVRIEDRVDAQLILGDACVRVDQHSSAIRAYEDALSLARNGSATLRQSVESIVSSRIGAALIGTHNYTKAVQYYKAALQNVSGVEEGITLRLSLANLYGRILQFDHAIRVLDEVQAKLQKEVDEQVQRNVRSALASESAKGTEEERTHSHSTNFIVARVADISLQKAVVNFDRYEHVICSRGSREELKAASESLVDSVENGIEALQAAHSTNAIDAAYFHNRIGVLLTYKSKVSGGSDSPNAVERAVEDLEAALKHFGSAGNSNVEAVTECKLSLSRLYLKAGKWQHAKREAEAVLSTSQSNIHALLLLAQIAFNQYLYEECVQRSQNALSMDPANSIALEYILESLYRIGDLRKFPAILANARLLLTDLEGASGVYKLDCVEGLYHLYDGRVQKSVSLLNRCRASSMFYCNSELAARALGIMLRIYGEYGQHKTAKDLYLKYREDFAGVRCIEWLVAPLYALMQPISHESFLLFLRGDRPSADVKSDNDIGVRCLVEYVELAQRQDLHDDANVLTALARAYLYVGQPTKARNQLRRVERLPYLPETCSSHEDALLLLSDSFLQASKIDAGKELLSTKLLRMNPFNRIGLELMGLVAQQTGDRAEAISFYERSQKCEGKSNGPAFLLKLIQLYLDDGNVAKAMASMSFLRETYPGNSVLEDEVLDCANNNLRA